MRRKFIAAILITAGLAAGAAVPIISATASTPVAASPG
jgi:hypothetical protein